MSIYRPYFYIIQHKTTGIYYAGSKSSAIGSNPDNLLKQGGYYTSSNTIKHIIEKEGLEAFNIIRIKEFECGKKAINYETKFLKKVDAKTNPKFYNQHNNNGTYDIEKSKVSALLRYGVEHHAKLDFRKNKQIENQKDKYNRPIVSEIKSLIESARELELDMKVFDLDPYWWQRSAYDLQDLQQRLTLAIEEKQNSGFIKRSRSQKMKDINAALFNRQIVTDIKTYASVTGTKLGPAWWRQSDEVLANLLTELKIKPYIHV